MSQVSFYPGPSRIYSNIAEYIYEAYMSGILSANHRSEPFTQLMAETKKLLHEKLLIPDNYEICFVSSATECWEIVAQSLVRERMTVAYNGAFGQKWSDYAQSIVKKATSVSYGINEALPSAKILEEDSDVIGLVHNETSNGTQIDQSILSEIRKAKSDVIIAVDATSSMAGVKLDFELADVWYASVQKCFGLPSGMAIMVLSPKAIERAFEVGNHDPYNALTRIVENTRKNQTHYTPNTLNIYLLSRTQDYSKGIDFQYEKITSRYQNWVKVINQLEGLDWLIEDPSLRSQTVLALTTPKPEKLKKAAAHKGLILGNGYGQWKDTTVRVANFPAIKGKEVEKLVKFLERYFD
jgi:phosphoserine aminotransferase